MKLQKRPFDWCLSVYIFIWLYISFDTLDILGNFDMIYQNLYSVVTVPAFMKSNLWSQKSWNTLNLLLFCVCYCDYNCILCLKYFKVCIFMLIFRQCFLVDTVFYPHILVVAALNLLIYFDRVAWNALSSEAYKCTVCSNHDLFHICWSTLLVT